MLTAMLREKFMDLVRVKGFVADEGVASHVVHELFDEVHVMTLTGDQLEFDEIVRANAFRRAYCNVGIFVAAGPNSSQLSQWPMRATT